MVGTIHRVWMRRGVKEGVRLELADDGLREPVQDQQTKVGKGGGRRGWGVLVKARGRVRVELQIFIAVEVKETLHDVTILVVNLLEVQFAKRSLNVQ